MRSRRCWVCCAGRLSACIQTALPRGLQVRHSSSVPRRARTRWTRQHQLGAKWHLAGLGDTPMGQCRNTIRYPSSPDVPHPLARRLRTRARPQRRPCTDNGRTAQIRPRPRHHRGNHLRPRSPCRHPRLCVLRKPRLRPGRNRLPRLGRRPTPDLPANGPMLPGCRVTRVR